MSPDLNERYSDKAVLGAEEYKNKNRLEHILQARERVAEVESKALLELIHGEIGEDGLNIAIQHAVKQYLEEVWNLLLREVKELDKGESAEYFEERKLGEIPFESRENLVIRGLFEFEETQRYYHERWTETVSWRHGSNVTREYTATHTVPARVSKRAYLTLNEFLDEEDDLDLQFEPADDSLPSWGYETVEFDEQLSDMDSLDDLRDAGVPIDTRAVSGDD